MGWIIQKTIKFHLLIIVLALLLVVIAVLQLKNMPIDVLPEFAPPYIDIQTEAPGLSTPEVEELITFNLEELLNGTPWLQSIRSTSVPGLSAIRLTFQPETDLLRARQLVNERLSLAYALPNVAMAPVILQPQSAMSRVMLIGLSSPQLSLIDLSILAQWNIRQALLSLQGVANVAIWGLRYKQLQVLVDPKELQANKVRLDQIIATTGNALWVSPLSFLNASTPGSGGWIDTPQQRIEVRHVLPISTPNDLAQVNIESSHFRLGSVTRIVNGYPPLIGDDIVNNAPGLLIAVDKFPKANTLDITRQVEAKLAELKPGLSGINIDTTLFRPAVFVESIITNISAALLVGFVLMGLTLLFLIRSWRAALISLISITVSFALAVLVLNFRGATLNLMVLAGLVMAVVIIIDEAVISVENLLFLQKNTKNKSIAELIIISSHKIRSPMIFGTLIILLILLPICFFTGINNAFFKPVTLSYAIAIMVAFFTATVFMPALCFLFLANRSSLINFHRQYPYYESAIKWICHRMETSIFLIITIGLSVLALVALALLVVYKNPPLLPPLKEPEILVQWDGPPGTSVEEMVRISTLASQELRAINGVDNVSIHMGRAVLGDQIVNVNSAQIIINISPKANYKTTLDNIKKVVTTYPGIIHVVQTYLENRTRQVLTGSASDIVVRIFGHDFEGLRAKAKEVKQIVSKINGATNIHIDLQTEQPEIAIKVNLQKAQQYGLKPGDIRRVAATLVAGLEVGSLYDEQKIFPVVVWGIPEVRHSIDSIRSLLIDTPSKQWVRLDEVARVSIIPAPNLIHHETVSRSIDVYVNAQERSVNAVLNEINSRLRQVNFPLEYRAKVLGVYQAQHVVLEQIVMMLLVVSIIIILLLQAILESFVLAFIIFFTLPFATIGGVLTAIAINCSSTLALLGLLVVYGITVRNITMLITQYQDHRDHTLNILLRTTQERCNPIIITALTSIMTLLPCFLLFAKPGLEIIGPMALIIASGLITSVIYSLLIMPALYWRFGKVNNDIVQEDQCKPTRY